MKAKAPQAQGMKWQARVKRRAKMSASEMVAWGESASGDGDGATAALDAVLARRKSTKKRKFESWNERAGGASIGEMKKKKTKKKKRSVVTSEEAEDEENEKADEKAEEAVIAPVVAPKKEKKKTTSTFASGNPFAALARRR